MNNVLNKTKWGNGELNWRILAPLCVIICGILWGIIVLFSNNLRFMGFESIQLTELRNLVAFLGMLAIVLHKDPTLLKINPKDLWMFLGTGVISIAVFNTSYFTCIAESSISVACTLLYTGPCFVLVISCIVFKEKFTILKGFALCTAIIGCAFITGLIGDGMQISGHAFIIGLCSGLGYGLYSIFGSIALKKYNWRTVITYTFFIAAASMMPFSNPSGIVSLAMNNSYAIINILLLGILSTLLPFLLYTIGLKHMETSKASMFTFIDPLVATIVSITIFHETFTINHAIGMIAIIGAITVLNIKPSKTFNVKKHIGSRLGFFFGTAFSGLYHKKA